MVESLEKEGEQRKKGQGKFLPEPDPAASVLCRVRPRPGRRRSARPRPGHRCRARPQPGRRRGAQIRPDHRCRARTRPGRRRGARPLPPQILLFSPIQQQLRPLPMSRSLMFFNKGFTVLRLRCIAQDTLGILQFLVSLDVREIYTIG